MHLTVWCHSVLEAIHWAPGTLSTSVLLSPPTIMLIIKSDYQRFPPPKKIQHLRLKIPIFAKKFRGKIKIFATHISCIGNLQHPASNCFNSWKCWTAGRDNRSHHKYNSKKLYTEEIFQSTRNKIMRTGHAK